MAPAMIVPKVRIRHLNVPGDEVEDVDVDDTVDLGDRIISPVDGIIDRLCRCTSGVALKSAQGE
jgi:hypothetical protein